MFEDVYLCQNLWWLPLGVALGQFPESYEWDHMKWGKFDPDCKCIDTATSVGALHEGAVLERVPPSSKNLQTPHC